MHSGKCYYTTTKKISRYGCLAPKIIFRNCLAASSETCEAPAPVNNTLAHALLGWHLTSLSVVTPQGFGYQTFLDWRTCPSHTAHQPGECDCSRLGLWVYRSLSLSSAKCHTAGPRHLTVHQQAPGKLLCISSAGSMARELLPTCCIQVLDKWIFYSRFFFFPSFSPGLSMPPFFFFLLSFDIFWKKNPNCQLPLQLRTNLKPALGFSQIHIHWTVFFFCSEILSRKLEGVRSEAGLYLLWASDILPSMWKYPDVSHSVCSCKAQLNNTSAIRVMNLCVNQLHVNSPQNVCSADWPV